MSEVAALLGRGPYAARDDATLLRELEALTQRHRSGCAAYARIVGERAPARSLEDLPYLHVSLFKQLDLKTESPDTKHGRTLLSSATTGDTPSRIQLDDESARLQSESVTAILRDFVGAAARPLLVLADPKALRASADVAASTAAALGLRGLASDIHFVVDATRVRWDKVAALARAHRALLVYGTSFGLWEQWGKPIASESDDVKRALAGATISFVHSGGWKRLAHAAVDRATFDGALLADAGAGSSVVDYYGLVEQNGVVFPLCAAGVRHVPRWAHLIVRDEKTLAPTRGRGLLQWMNPLARGAPYHNVLTEDVGRIVEGACACGRDAPAFELLGRLPRAVTRGCGDTSTPTGSARTLVNPPPTLTPTAKPWSLSEKRTLLIAHDHEALFDAYGSLHRAMARTHLSEFTRDEWAYLASFFEPAALRARVAQTFAGTDDGAHLFFRPASPMAIWLPSTVGSLGALVTVLASIGGGHVRAKVSSRREDPTAAFARFVVERTAGSPLAAFFADRVSLIHASRDEAASHAIAHDARLRIVFGSDRTAAAIETLPHPITSRFVAFVHRTSEAWISRASAADASVQTLLRRVFAVYGQAACTAPRRVVIVDGTRADAGALAAALAHLHDDSNDAPASDALLGAQWGRALGHRAHVADGHLSVVLEADIRAPLVDATPALHVTCGTREEAFATLPEDLQTVGLDPSLLADAPLVAALASRGAARVVPLAKMHSFGETWDGVELLRAMFEATSVLA